MFKSKILQVDLALQVVTDLGHVAHEHAAGAGDGVLLLAALTDDGEDHLADLLVVVAAGFGDLGEGGGVNVQSGDVAQNFIGVDFVHVVVDFISGLSQNTLGFNNAMGTVLVTFFLVVIIFTKILIYCLVLFSLHISQKKT